MGVLILTIIFVAALAVQLTYLILFLVAFGKKRVPISSVPHSVSVIICAHDQEQNLRELVPLLLQQKHPRFEVIVVEDRCNDGTFDYLLEATKENNRLKMVRVVEKPEHLSGKKFGITLGIKAATYDWVLLTEADCRPSGENWLTQMTEKYVASTRLVIGFSSYFKVRGLLNSFIRFESFIAGINFLGFALRGKPYKGVGQNLAYEKSLFLTNKGFNKHLSLPTGDDDLFVNEHANAQNTVAQFGREALTFAQAKTTWKEFYRQKVRQMSVARRYKFSDRFRLGLFAMTWMISCFLVIPTVIYSEFGWWLAGAFLLRSALLTGLVHLASRKMGDPFETWKVPILDFIYALCYLVADAVAFVSKK